MFIRLKTDKKGRTYASLEERVREGKKIKTRYIKSLGRVGGGRSPGWVVPFLPVMIAYDLVSGNRVAKLKEQLAKGGPHGPQPASQWQQLKAAELLREHMVGKPNSFAARERAYQTSHPTPNYRAHEEYAALAAQNKAQIDAYWATVEDGFARNERSFEQYAKDHAASKGEAAKDGGSKDAGKGDGGKGGEGGKDGQDGSANG